MSDSLPQKLNKVIKIDESQIQAHLGELVRGTDQRLKTFRPFI